MQIEDIRWIGRVQTLNEISSFSVYPVIQQIEAFEGRIEDSEAMGFLLFDLKDRAQRLERLLDRLMKEAPQQSAGEEPEEFVPDEAVLQDCLGSYFGDPRKDALWKGMFEIVQKPDSDRFRALEAVLKMETMEAAPDPALQEELDEILPEERGA